MKIFVLFVEPMLYGIDLIHEVYEKTEHEFLYVYCTSGLTGRDDLLLPESAVICKGNKKEKRKTLLSELKKFNPDFAIINGYIGNEQVCAIRFCQRRRIKYAIESDTQLNIPRNIIKALVKKAILRRLLHNQYCYGFPGGTPQMDNLVYYGIPKEKNYIMPMSVSVDRLQNAWKDAPPKEQLRKQFKLSAKFVFLYVGRLSREKNVSLLIKAFTITKEEHHDIALVIVGDGIEREELHSMAKNDENIIFAGYRLFPELIDYYKAADVLVLPSLYEPWGLVVNEAMILGLPVIVSDAVGCLHDLVRQEENGFIFESNKIESLCQCMNQARDYDLKILSDNARERGLYWNYNLYKKLFIKALEEIVNVETI